MFAGPLFAVKTTESMEVGVDHSRDGESQVPYVVSVLTVACVLSTTVVVLRLFTRIHILNTFGADDAVMGFAQVLTLGSAAAIYLGNYVLCPVLTDKSTFPC